MKSNYKPKEILLYREYPVENDEIQITFENDSQNIIVNIYRRVVIRDGDFLPVAEGLLMDENVGGQRDYYPVAGKTSLSAYLNINAANMARLKPNQEYSALIEYGSTTNFAWTDLLLANLETFKNWEREGNASLVEQITSLLPVSFEVIPFHVRPMLDGAHYDLCMDFGTSFSTCALSINPAKSKDLACFKKTDTPRSIYYTRFTSDEQGNQKNIVPSVMVLKKLRGDKEAEWLCGFDAVNWMKKNPERGSFVKDLKSLLLDLDRTQRLYDCDNKAHDFTNKEIVSAFLKYLTDKSKRYFGIDFKNIHITTPVLYPDRQRLAYEEILGDLGFTEIKNKLDEARAPLYHFLSSKVESSWNGASAPLRNFSGDKGGEEKTLEKTSAPQKPVSYLIIDCGGGSTDATLLRAIQLLPPRRAGGGINMSTEEPRQGGNTDFGGTDLTDLLYHYVKMRILEQLRPEEFAALDPALRKDRDYLIDVLIEPQDKNIFWELYRREKGEGGMDAPASAEIPNIQHKFAYGRFEDIARQIEALLPTDEKKSTELDQVTWSKINRNHSTIWQLAEMLKLAIYASDGPKTINLTSLKDGPKISFWLRSASEELEKVDAANFKNGLSFDKYELNKLFRPIIFKEMSRILRQLHVKGDLNNPDMLFNVRFVGQSTNIPLFNEALAYFIPQAMIEEENRDYQDQGASRFQPILSEEKKICCVTGAAHFLDHVTRGCLKDAKFVATTRVLKNVCRFGKNGQPISVGVFGHNGEESPFIITRDAPMSEARGAIIRDLSDDVEEFFGTSQDEIIKQEGFVNFKRSDMSHKLNAEERKELEKRWATLLKQLMVDPENPGMLLEVELKECGTAQRYEFRPYYWDETINEYFSTPEPLTWSK